MKSSEGLNDGWMRWEPNINQSGAVAVGTSIEDVYGEHKHMNVYIQKGVKMLKWSFFFFSSSRFFGGGVYGLFPHFFFNFLSSFPSLDSLVL